MNFYSVTFLCNDKVANYLFEKFEGNNKFLN